MRALPRAYRDLIETKALSADPAQADAVMLLDSIAHSVEARVQKGFGLSRLFKRAATVKGAYIWGDVGRGKTLLMDMFFDAVANPRKRRVHFHAFMDEMHAGIADFRAKSHGEKGRRDPIPVITKPIIDSVDLLCLDEFHVQDITNAMLLQRLFERLFAAGVVVVATSNVEPNRLYENGLNRQLFLPFIDLIIKHMTILHLAAATDYRREKLAGLSVYHFGTGKDAHLAMDAAWQRLTGGWVGQSASVKSLGRDIKVPEQALGVVRFPFADLCEKPLGARDYLRLVDAYQTFIIDDVPQFDRRNSNAAKRFILLVDTLYDRGAKLAASFAVPLHELGADSQTAFEFERCVSRLIEMQSEQYLSAA